MEVIIRKGNLGENDIVAFDVTKQCEEDYIFCIDMNGNADTACIDYYNNSTSVTPAEENKMINYLKEKYNTDIKIRKNLTKKLKESIWN